MTPVVGISMTVHGEGEGGRRQDLGALSATPSLHQILDSALRGRSGRRRSREGIPATAGVAARCTVESGGRRKEVSRLEETERTMLWRLEETARKMLSLRGGQGL